MQVYIFRRLLQIPVSVLGITMVIFFLVRLHGDPVDLYLPYEAGEDVRAQVSHNWVWINLWWSNTVASSPT